MKKIFTPLTLYLALCSGFMAIPTQAISTPAASNIAIKTEHTAMVLHTQQTENYIDSVQLAITEAEKQITLNTGNEVGFYSPSLAVALEARLATVKATLSNTTMSDNDRQQQVLDIKAELQTFLNSLATAQVVQPRLSDNTTEIWYTLQTPKRNGRYTFSKGIGENLSGRSAIMQPASTWKFVLRTDNSYDIVNANGTFVSPSSSNNTPLKTVASSPDKGWTISKASEVGYVIITSGNVQFNQTNVTNTPIYNWGSGTNLSDVGCMFFVREVPATTSMELFRNDKITDIPYRIPAIAQAKNGNLIAISDHRPGVRDIGYGEVDIMARISKDNGRTWEPAKTLLDGQGGSGFNAGYGDASVVADRESNRVLVMGVAGNVPFPTGKANNPPPVFRLYSDDGGETWQVVENVADSIYPLFTPDKYSRGPINALFFTSGRLHQSFYYKKPGAAYYRIYGALAMRNSNNELINAVVFSDDFGKSWKVLGGAETPAVPNGNEAKIEELPDGNVLISSRIVGGRLFNIFTFTDVEKGEGVWSNAAISNANNKGTLTVADRWGCNGEILIVPAKRKADGKTVSIALQSMPLGDDRSNVGIYYKDLDDPNTYGTPALLAQNWDGVYQVSKALSAYSVMTMQQDDSLGFLFEEDTYGVADTYRYCIRYQKFALETITNGAYAFNTDTTRAAMMTNILAQNLPLIRQQAEQLLASAQKVGQVGYQTKEAKEALEATLANPSASYSALQLAKSNFETSFQMPIEGAFYVFRNIQQSGKEFFLKDNGTTLTTVTAKGVDPSLANTYVCKKLTNGKYAFVNALTGNYLVWRNNGGNTPGYNSNKGVMPNDRYSEAACSWTLNSARSSLEGAFYIVSLRSTGAVGSMVVMNATGNFDGWGNSVAFAANYSNLWRIENFEHPYNQVELKTYDNNTEYLATTYLPYATTLPTGVKAYKAHIEDGKAVAEEIATDQVLPANTAAILVGSASDIITLTPSLTKGIAVTNNTLVGSLTAETPIPANAYSLGEVAGRASFLPLNVASYPIAQALLIASDNTVTAYPLTFAGITSINSIKTTTTEEPFYDLSGRRLTVPQRGILLQKGKKLVR